MSDEVIYSDVIFVKRNEVGSNDPDQSQLGEFSVGVVFVFFLINCLHFCNAPPVEVIPYEKSSWQSNACSQIKIAIWV